MCTFGLFSITLISVASSDIAKTDSNRAYPEDVGPDNLIDKRQGGYSTNQYNVNPYQYDYSGYQNQYSNGISSKNYDSADNKEGVDGAFTSDGLDRQDVFGGDALSLFAAGLAAGAAIAATVGLIQNSQQTSTNDFNALKDRVSSLESDQTSICTSVKAVTSADDGKTISGNFDNNVAAESGYLSALAAAASPTCS